MRSEILKIIGLVIFMAILMWAFTSFTKIINTTEYEVINPKKNVECFVARSSQGVGVDCWKTG